jgi:hypothetical protein
MKIKISSILFLAGISLGLVGCINTVSGTKKAAIPFLKDRVEARYERSADQVFTAAKAVVARSGTIASAGSLFNKTNDVRVLEGKVKQSTVYVRVEAIEPRLTAVSVQARSTYGTGDRDLAIQIDKEIALQLAR